MYRSVPLPLSHAAGGAVQSSTDIEQEHILTN